MTENLRIELFVADVEQTLDFYRKLGFEVMAEKLSDSPPYASVRRGNIRFGICGSPAVEPSRRAYPVGVEIVVEVDDVYAERERVRAVGGEVAEDLTQRPWGLVDFRINDPDGYYLRFTSVR